RPNTNNYAATVATQAKFLDEIARQKVPQTSMNPEEVAMREEFRVKLEALGQKAFRDAYPESKSTLRFIPYGSILSGFAVTGSDMDIICSWDGPRPDLPPEEIPRMLEKVFLAEKIGARALTKTRVPILKICEEPPLELLTALTEEHEKWQNEVDAGDVSATTPTSPVEAGTEVKTPTEDQSKSGLNESKKADSESAHPSSNENKDKQEGQKSTFWRREKPSGPLDFPKTGAGYQCDISFRSILGMYNTQLLRCYNACDPRVHDMVIFIKAWAKQRKINNSYSGTLCSYGWVLLVLHYLMNVATPPVVPNLHHFGANDREFLVDGFNVSFADNETEIRRLAIQRKITRNTESTGSLLRGFFHYYAHQGSRVARGGFKWKDEVVAIKNVSGIVSKASKNWTGASNTMVNNVEVRQRYLLAIECPIEDNHNVARTVHHHGVVAIRDELRRAWSIIESVGQGRMPQVSLFDEVLAPEIVAP
ncbi:PAP/OAS1 substrate-binding domain-containing protein, partial [Microthyrium microscopicum]